MKYLLSCVCLLFLCACNNDKNTQVQPTLPDHPVTGDEAYITQEYIDSLDMNRKQRLIDLRRELGFECIDIAQTENVSMKIKVQPDGSYEDIQVLEQEGIDLDPVRECIMNWFAQNKDINFGMLKDLPSSGKTTNKHPHVYTLLIY